MASLLTNTAATSALQTLRMINNSMDETQSRVSSGLRISSAIDNAAYWSISTTMRSDDKAISAVSDALGLASAITDTAYAAMTSVSDILGDFKAKLVAAKEDGVDKAKIQEELSQLQQQVVSISTSASFNGVNWLNTQIADMHDDKLNQAFITSGFIRSESTVAVKSTALDLSEISLFNSTGDGLLQRDSRDIGTIGGIRNFGTYMDNDGVIWTDRDNDNIGRQARFDFVFPGPFTFPVNGEITFEITVDADNPADLLAPHHLGQTTTVTINRSLVNSVLPNSNGLIDTNLDYISVINRALANAGADAGATYQYEYINGINVGIDSDFITIFTRETSGLDGSSIEITAFQSSNLPSTGLGNRAIEYGARGSSVTTQFAPYQVFKDGDNEDGIVVTFDFAINRATPKQYSFDRTYVNNLLGITDGIIRTADDQVTILQSLLLNDWPDLIIETAGTNQIVLRTDRDVDRQSGAKTNLGFTAIDVNIEPISETDFLSIDIVYYPEQLNRYITYVEMISQDVINAAATLGSLQMRIEMQEDFANTLMDSISSGIGRLVDADMNEESTRLKALQTQKQLGIQSLSIANANAENIITLFR
jgi:flagellin